MNADVIIIGAGALGTSVAYHLAARGLRAHVFEREQLPGSHASGKNAGMIRQLYRNEHLTDWTARSIRLWPEELRTLCFRETGSIVVGRKSPSHHADLFEERLVRVERSGRKKTSPAVYSRTDGLLDSPAYMNLLCRLAKNAGAEFSFQQSIASVERAGGGFRVRTQSGAICDAPRLVNAGGAWITECLRESLGVSAIQAQPFARHLYVVSGFPKDYMPEEGCGFYWNEEDSWYMRRWDAETRLVSICDRLPAVPETFVPAADQHEKLAGVLLNSLPALARELRIVRSWHCFRTYTEDQLPIWGEDPSCPGFFWLAAFGGFGMSTSFAAALDAAEHISGVGGKEIPEFSPGRWDANGLQWSARLQSR